MKFKVTISSVACFAILLQTAHSGDISEATNAALNTARGIATIAPTIVKDKAAAVGKATADMASIVTMGAGLEVDALGTAAASMKTAVSNGLYALGNVILKAGNTITGDYPNYNGGLMVRAPHLKEKVVEFKDRPSLERRKSSVWRLLRNSAKSRAHGRRKAIRIGGSAVRRVPLAYKIVDSPRLYKALRKTYHKK